MKIDNYTKNILINFSNIYPSIIIDKGNELTSSTPLSTIIASAKVPTTFDSRFAIYDLKRFMSIISTFNDPDFTFGEKYVDISEGNRLTRYVYADESVIGVKYKKVALPYIDVSLTLTNEDMKTAIKAASLLGVPMIAISGRDGKLLLEAIDPEDPTGDSYYIEVGHTDKTFSMFFKKEHMVMIPGDYNVDICFKGISKFYTDSLEYFVAVEAKYSTF